MLTEGLSQFIEGSAKDASEKSFLMAGYGHSNGDGRMGCNREMATFTTNNRESNSIIGLCLLFTKPT